MSLTSREGYSGVQRQAASVWAVVSVVFFPQVQEIWSKRDGLIVDVNRYLIKLDCYQAKSCPFMRSAGGCLAYIILNLLQLYNLS